jgi:transcriptional regulator GlxA family with amidase domain
MHAIRKVGDHLHVILDPDHRHFTRFFKEQVGITPNRSRSVTRILE